MKRFTKIFIKLITYISILLFIVVLYDSLFKIENNLYIKKIIHNPYIIYWITSTMLIFIFNLLNNYINKASNKKLKILKIALVAIMIVLQIIIISLFNPVQKTDALIVNDQAISIAEGIEKKVPTSNTYFQWITNNNGVLILSIYLVKIFKLIHIDYTLGFTIFSAITIDLGILATYLLSKKIKDEKFATKVLALSILNPLNYLYIHWTYTSTYSLPFMVLLVYLAFLIKDSKTNTRKIIYSILFSICLITGFYIRPTLVIGLIAIIVCYLLYLLNKRTTIKDTWIPVVTVSLASILLFTGVSNYNKTIVENTKPLPMTHWLMMGIHGNGTVNSKDNAYTLSYDTKEEQKEANIKEIKRTIKEYRLSGLVKHTLIKLAVSWSDGSNSYYLRMNQIHHKTPLYNWVVGGKKDMLVVYSQAFRIATLALCLFTLASQKKDKLDKTFLMTLTIFGAMLFFILWESKNAYSFVFLPFLFILIASGLDNLNILIKSKKHIIKPTFIIVIIITLLIELTLYNNFVISKFAINDYNIAIDSSTHQEHIKNLNKDNITIKQEFKSKNKFNRINIIAIKLNENENINYDINLYNKNYTLLKSYTINQNDVKNYNIILNISHDDLKNNTNYILEIKPNKNNIIKEDTIDFLYLNHKNIKNYEGDMYINNKRTHSNLKMQIYDKKLVRYMSGKTYAAISLIVIISESMIYYYTKRTYTKE